MLSPVKTYICNVADHTMEDALFRYLSIKMHSQIFTWEGESIVVRGLYNRKHSAISTQEKSGKLFNWKRPTAEISSDNKILYINCFPGIDYIRHYAALIKSYFHINKIKNRRVFYELPTQQQCIDSLLAANITAMPAHDIVIIGKVENLTQTQDHSWEGDGDFLWTSSYIAGKKVAFLGCTFSFWGDIAGNIVRILGGKAIKSVIYTGKLGGLDIQMPTNQILATGTQSWLSGRAVSWNNIIKIPQQLDNVVIGKHITLYSTLLETKKWFDKKGCQYSFVDPEIGHMAYAAIKHKVDFGYIHLVSDNVASVRNENLSNERDQEIIEKRVIANNKISEIIESTIYQYR